MKTVFRIHGSILVRSFCILCCLTLMTWSANAQEAAAPKVVSVKSNGGNPLSAGLEEEVSVTVKGATAFRPEALGNNTLELFFDGIPLTDVNPSANSIDSTGNGVLSFDIPYSEKSFALWDRFSQARPPGFEHIFSRQVSVSVGIAGGVPLKTDVQNFSLILVSRVWFWVALAVIGAIILIFMGLVARTEILREDGPDPPPGLHRPYSLAKVQMAVWTLSLIVAWVFLYVIDHTMDSIPDSLVALMGISAGTGVAVRQLVTGRQLAGTMVSRGFLRDVLTDETGVSFHQFQLAAWTVVAAVVFWRQAIFHLRLPEFPASILLLIGISSATHIGSQFAGRLAQPTPVVPSSATSLGSTDQGQPTQ